MKWWYYLFILLFFIFSFKTCLADTVILNSASGLDCDTICANAGGTCLSVGTDEAGTNTAYQFNSFCFNLFLGTCETVMTSTGDSCAHANQWTNCLCTGGAPTNYTLTYTANAGGSLTGSTTQIVAQGSNGSAVQAVASSSYSFVDWSDASTTNPRIDYNVQGNITVSANFVFSTSTTPTTTAASCTPDVNTNIETITSCSFASSTGITYTNYNAPFILYIFFASILGFVLVIINILNNAHGKK